MLSVQATCHVYGVPTSNQVHEDSNLVFLIVQGLMLEESTGHIGSLSGKRSTRSMWIGAASACNLLFMSSVCSQLNCCLHARVPSPGCAAMAMSVDWEESPGLVLQEMCYYCLPIFPGPHFVRQHSTEALHFRVRKALRTQLATVMRPC